MPSRLQLHPFEAKIIRRYQNHLRKVSGLLVNQREAVGRLIRECGEELEIMEKELDIEARTGSGTQQ